MLLKDEDYGLFLIVVFDTVILLPLFSRPRPEPLRFLTGYIKEPDGVESKVRLYALYTIRCF